MKKTIIKTKKTFPLSGAVFNASDYLHETCQKGKEAMCMCKNNQECKYGITNIKMKELKLNEALCIIYSGWETELEKELCDYARLVVRRVAEEKHLEYERNYLNEKLDKLQKEKENEASCIIDAGRVGIGTVIPATEFYVEGTIKWKAEVVNHSEKLKKKKGNE
jgi:hypothetical protein